MSKNSKIVNRVVQQKKDEIKLKQTANEDEKLKINSRNQKVKENIKSESSIKENENAGFIGNSNIKYQYGSYKGFTTRKTKKENQDYLKITSLKDQYLFTVADGHGPEGEKISSFVTEEFHNLIKTEMDNRKKSKIEFEKLIPEINNQVISNIKTSSLEQHHNGTTLVNFFLSKNISNQVCSWTGDSRAVVLSLEKTWTVKKTTKDHNPADRDELRRITKCGGQVKKLKNSMGDESGPLRVFNKNSEIPGLAMTRSFGDQVGHDAGIIHDSEVKREILTKFDRAIVMGSDGLFEFMDDSSLVKVISKFYNDKDPKGATKRLLDMTQQLWKIQGGDGDDITVIVVFIQHE